ncbi:hypothetical protein SB717_38180, partial [Priestia sp. SIMBA_032]|uniref:hypothetical protein n=1 Tax=Priestia sp. SIMBA_032 TaxID=3085775 RepID=UPI00397D9385
HQEPHKMTCFQPATKARPAKLCRRFGDLGDRSEQLSGRRPTCSTNCSFVLANWSRPASMRYERSR